MPRRLHARRLNKPTPRLLTAVLVGCACNRGRSVASTRDFLDPWKVQELERDLARAREMEEM
eukprot:COSAG01_NODE_799_length_13501_cov_15.980749_1_plen_61_part_10